MNILRKIYCRCFQKAFWLAIPLLPYRNPVVLNSCKSVGGILKEKNIKKALVVTDEFITKTHLADSLINSLNEAKVDFAVYDKAIPNPTISNIENAREMYLSNNCDALVAIGGGSCIDCAKAVGARLARPKKTLRQMEGILKIVFKPPFTVAIPTTAGTGSEVTVTTVVTDDETGHKYPISDFPLIPDVCVHDGEITKGLPPHLTATTGMDALTHAIEAYIGGSTTKSSRKDALGAAKLVAENLYKAYTDGNNITARENMLKAAFMAGRAFSKSYVGYCHAVAHSLGGKYHTPHGLANAVLLPYTLEAYGKNVYKKAKDIAIAMGFCQKDTPADEACKKLIEKIREMNEKMGIPQKLEGIKKEDIPELAAYADKEANPIYPVPKLMDKHELEKLYYDVMEEKL